MIYLTYEQAAKILLLFGGDSNTVVTLSSGGGHSGKGIYLGYKDLPEEGAVYLGEEE